VSADDAAVLELRRLTEARAVARWRSDGVVRRCGPTDEPAEAETEAVADLLHTPAQRLAVIGWDPFALAIAAAGAALGWTTTLIRPAGPGTPPPVETDYTRLPVDEALAAIRPDPWTALAVATHDPDLDHDALVAALGTEAGYVGVLGARRRLPERLARLRDAGVEETALERLRAPIGLDIGAANPREVAVAVAAEIVASRRAQAAATTRAAA
jgi:xanthine dehydrogenase accessory factor